MRDLEGSGLGHPSSLPGTIWGMEDVPLAPDIAELAKHVCPGCHKAATASVREGPHLRLHWDCGRYEMLIGALSPLHEVHWPDVVNACGGSPPDYPKPPVDPTP